MWRETPLEALSLGAFHSEHPRESDLYWNAVFSLAILVAACLGMLVFMLLVVPRPTDLASFSTLLLVFVLPGLMFAGLLIRRLWQRRQRVLLLEHGFVVEDGHRVLAFRWDEIESLRESITEVIGHGVHYVERTLVVCRRDGKTARLHSHYKDIDELCEAIQAAVCTRLVARAKKAIAEGKPVGFGPVRLTREGFDDGGLKLLPWKEYAGAVVEKGYLNVRSWGQKSDWFSRPMGDITNFRVLLALLPGNPDCSIPATQLKRRSETR